MRRVLTSLIVLTMLGALGYGLWTLVLREQGAQEAPPTATAVIVDIVDDVVVTGAIEPRDEVALKPRVAGVVTELFVQPGDRVEAGDKVAHVEIVANEASLAASQSRVRAARLDVANAEIEAAQVEDLVRKGVMSNDEQRRVKLGLRQAKEELRAARESLRAIREGAVRQGEDAANFVVATASGTVLAVPIKRGASVVDNNSFNEGTTVATVADMDDLVFRGWVDESDVGRLEVGMSLTLAIGALTDAQLNGVIEHIAPKGEERDGIMKFEVRAAVTADAEHELRAGYSANASVEIGCRYQVLALPERLLQFDPHGEPFVEVLVTEQPPSFERRELELGLSDGIHVELLAGVAQSESVRVPDVGDY
ncbi:MAG: efflux RND transporter periplasmic adaptor subunit [Myxococcota bacterium]